MITSALVLALYATAATTAASSPDASVGRDEATKAEPGKLPEAVQKAFQRELAPLPKVRFEIPRAEGAFEIEAEAKGKISVTQNEETDSFAVPLGTELDIQCFFSRTRVGAQPFASMLERMKEAVEVLSVRPVEVSAPGGSAALFVDVVYLVDRQGQKNVGFLKQATVAYSGYSLTCLHDEPGYDETFRRVVKGIGASLAAAIPEGEKVRYAEVLAVKVQGMAVGFATNTIARGKRGASIAESSSRMVIPRSPSEIVALDKASSQTTDVAGRLISGRYRDATANELETDLALRRGKDGKTYRYRGTMKGKHLKGKFATRNGLAGDSLIARRIPGLLAGSSQEERFQEYSPSANPRGPVESVYRKDQGNRRISVDMGGVKLREAVDANYWPSLIEMPIGTATVTYERIWSRGAP
ncbi:MAG TPA: hypothetical protein VMK12_02495 [Anaeromyxobacteraceae bacterium]|nr:hypothetical protein [Anaeromyxobacteraceae bacterium]